MSNGGQSSPIALTIPSLVSTRQLPNRDLEIAPTDGGEIAAGRSRDLLSPSLSTQLIIRLILQGGTPFAFFK